MGYLVRTVLFCLFQFAAVAATAQNHIVKDIPLDSTLNKMLQPYKHELDAEMNEVLGRTDITLTKQQPECTLGNMMADAIRMYGRAADPAMKISIQNYGGIRISELPAGPIEKRELYELMPFDNSIVIAEVPGSIMKQLCDHMAAAKGWPVSGISYTIKNGKANNIMVDEKPLDERLVYKVAMSDYTANGGDNCHFLKSCKRKETGILIREALISYVRRLNASNAVIHPEIEGRVKNE